MNYKIVVDPGHGGSDPGAIGNGITEKDINLDISKYMYDRFQELGVPVSITRDTDVTLEPTARANKVKSFYGNGRDVIVLANHINAGGGDGFEVVYALRDNDTLAKMIADEIAKEGQNVRKYYQRRASSDPSKDYYYILRDTANTQANLIEYGFLDSPGDDVGQLKNNWRDYSEAVVRAVMKYIGRPYTPPMGDLSDYYTVKAGDSLWSIANKYGLSVEELKKINNLTSNLISVGQQLRVSKGESNGGKKTTYKVVAGDTLYSIASKYGLSVDELKKVNNLTSNTLLVGQALDIPTESSGIEYLNYTVKGGDTLYQIAMKYGVSVDDIKRANNLTSDALSIGQILKIPGVSVNPTIYTVRAGDSLYRIARDFNTTVEEVISLNNLMSTSLSVGQQLLIP